LNSGGRLWLEIGAEQGEKVQALFTHSYWKTKRIERDWAGHQRFFFLEIE
jgi:release factor glutamine methyltransferase